MFGFYLATAIIGWAFVGLFVFGGLDSDVDGGFDIDVDGDLDIDLDGDVEVGDGGLASGVMAAGLSLLSFRSIVFFLAFFGLTGLILDVMDAATATTLIAAAGVGLFAWVFNSFVFRALKVGETSSTLRSSDLRGALGEVVLPISAGHRGRIAIEVGEQRRYLTAEPYDPSRQESFGVGDQIVVMDLNRGAARVAPIEVLES